MPWVTIAVIAICTLVQFYSTFVAPSERDVELQQFALQARYEDSEEELTPEQAKELAQEIERILNQVPQYRWGYKTGSGLSPGLVTSIFVHGDWFHLIGNMLFLWLAGSALEDRYGRLRFALFYLLGGVAATSAYELTATGEHWLVGASGAISACMGAFLVHFHKTEITFWYLIMYRTGTFRWPAWFALPLWLAEQVLYTLLYRSMGAVSQVAHAAHIGGFVAGLAGGFAISRLFPHDADHDDVEYDAPAQPQREADAQLDARIAKCVAALQARDMVNIKQLSSRVILDLARIDNHGRILEIYQALAKQLSTIPLTDGAFAAAATAADRLDDRRTFVSIAGSMMAEHPGSIQLPKVVWRLAQIHRERGEHELEQDMLRVLATRFPRHELGQQAQLELDRQS